MPVPKVSVLERVVCTNNQDNNLNKIMQKTIFVLLSVNIRLLAVPFRQTSESDLWLQ